jgi:hypothetical protein
VHYRHLSDFRSQLARDRGFTDYVDMQKSRHGITTDQWSQYLDLRRDFAHIHHPRLEQISTEPHFLSQIPELDISYPDGVWQLLPDSDLRLRIVIKTGDNSAKFTYLSDSDVYEIYIPQTHKNQQISMLIHELGHVLYSESRDRQVHTIPESEIGAYQHEHTILQKLPPEFMTASIREYLMCLVRLDFQISMYKDPKTDIVEAYTQAMERYIGTMAVSCMDFLLDDRLVSQPLSDMPAGVGLVLAHV